MVFSNGLSFALIVGIGTTLGARGFANFDRTSRLTTGVYPAKLGATREATSTAVPEFKTKEEYLSYLESVSSLPKGFATGTAEGQFVPVEAPLMGDLPIRATVIHLPDGPTDSWAAVFTKNRVSACKGKD